MPRWMERTKSNLKKFMTQDEPDPWPQMAAQVTHAVGNCTANLHFHTFHLWTTAAARTRTVVEYRNNDLTIIHLISYRPKMQQCLVYRDSTKQRSTCGVMYLCLAVNSVMTSLARLLTDLATYHRRECARTPEISAHSLHN